MAQAPKIFRRPRHPRQRRNLIDGAFIVMFNGILRAAAADGPAIRPRAAGNNQDQRTLYLTFSGLDRHRGPITRAGLEDYLKWKFGHHVVDFVRVGESDDGYPLFGWLVLTDVRHIPTVLGPKAPLGASGLFPPTIRFGLRGIIRSKLGNLKVAS